MDYRDIVKEPCTTVFLWQVEWQNYRWCL